MGLASKLAAAQASGGGAAPGGAPPPQAQTQQYGAPPQQQQQQYGAPQSQGGYAGAGAGQGQPPAPGGRPTSGQYAPPSGPPPPSQSQSQYGQPQSQSQYGQQGQSQYGQQGQGQGQSQYGQPQGGQPQYGQPQGGQSQYGAPPPAYGAQPPTQPPAQVSGGGAGQNSSPQFLLSQLQACVQDQNIQAFYPPGSLEMIATKVASSGALDRIASEWRMPKELASDLVKLALFDIVILADDSGSMAFEEGGERIDDLKLVLSRVAQCASLFDHDGIQIRFLNSRVEGNGINSEAAALQLVQQVKFSGLTPLGTQMRNKIIEPLVLGPARQNRLEKPVLIITITDGTPAGENRDEIINVILRTDQELKRTRYGPDAVSYQFAQVGNDAKATKFLEELDNHPQIGGLIDATSPFEVEQAEMSRKSGIDLTPEMWLVKLMMGPIDSSYDTKDE